MYNAENYEEFSFQIAYYLNPGTALLPSSGPDGTPASIVKTSAAYGRKVVSWRARRRGDGAMPMLPHPDPLNDNEVLTDPCIIKVSTPAKMPDSTIVVQVEGEYNYILKKPMWVDDRLPMGKQPVDPTNASTYEVRPEHFSKTLLAETSSAPPPSIVKERIGLPTFIEIP